VVHGVGVQVHSSIRESHFADSMSPQYLFVVRGFIPDGLRSRPASLLVEEAGLASRAIGDESPHYKFTQRKMTVGYQRFNAAALARAACSFL
jgi:hypothetical protein